MASEELLWCLVNEGAVEDMKKLNLHGVDWGSRGEIEGETLVVAAIESGMLARAYEEGLKKVEWLITQGASISQECKFGDFRIASSDDKKSRITVQRGGLSAIGYVEQWLFKLHDKDDWKGTSDYLRQVLKIFARTQSQQPRVSVHEGIVELWEKALSAKASHDLTIETADGEVTAHAHMLKEASIVTRAMLESPMKEGKAQRIEMKDTSSSAVSLFLEILYTCSAQCDPDFQIALQALDLAHRWQVGVVVDILTELLADKITDESFSAIAEHAILKNLGKLKTAAQSFGAASKAVKGQLKEGQLPALVAQLFQGATEAPKATRKRKRL